MTSRRVIALIFGLLGLAAAAALIAGASAVLLVDRDDDGFYVTNAHTFEQSSSAIVSEDLDILSEAPGWVVDVLADPVDLRISGSTERDEGLFIGIARTDDVDRFLEGVAHHEVTHIEFDGRSIRDVDYTLHAGTSAATPPVDVDIWEVSAVGGGSQTLDWDLDAGNWTVVVMNPDGAAGVDADLVLGAKVANMIAIAWTVMGFGLFSLLGGAVLVFIAVLRSDQPRPPHPEPLPADLPPPQPLSTVHLPPPAAPAGGSTEHDEAGCGSDASTDAAKDAPTTPREQATDTQASDAEAPASGEDKAQRV